MKRYYSKFRIMLMTFALGLASVFIFNGSLNFSDEIYVNLPKTEYGEVIVIFPKNKNEMPNYGINKLQADYEK